jgi:hypothetical protein
LRRGAGRALIPEALANPLSRLFGVAVPLVSLLVVALTVTPPGGPAQGPHLAPLLPRASLLRIGGRAFLTLLADYYWLQAIQATGKANSEEEYRDIAEFAQLTTDLDPDFGYVYQFAGVVVPFNRGRETWRNTRESTALLEKGVARFPKWVFLKTLLAYNYSVFEKQYARAAELLDETARLPGAPAYLPLLATRLYAQAGSFDAASAFATQFAESAADPETRAAFEHRTREIALERILQELDRVVADFHQRQGRWPTSVKELLRSGQLPALPEDPLGGEIRIGEDGRTYSTSQQHRLEVYDPIKDAPTQ